MKTIPDFNLHPTTSQLLLTCLSLSFLICKIKTVDQKISKILSSSKVLEFLWK